MSGKDPLQTGLLARLSAPPPRPHAAIRVLRPLAPLPPQTPPLPPPPPPCAALHRLSNASPLPLAVRAAAAALKAAGMQSPDGVPQAMVSAADAVCRRPDSFREAVRRLFPEGARGVEGNEGKSEGIIAGEVEKTGRVVTMERLEESEGRLELHDATKGSVSSMETSKANVRAGYEFEAHRKGDRAWGTKEAVHREQGQKMDSIMEGRTDLLTEEHDEAEKQAEKRDGEEAKVEGGPVDCAQHDMLSADDPVTRTEDAQQCVLTTASAARPSPPLKRSEELYNSRSSAPTARHHMPGRVTRPAKRSRKRKGRLTEVFRLQKALETALWTDSKAVQAQDDVIIISDDDMRASSANADQADEKDTKARRRRVKSEPGYNHRTEDAPFGGVQSKARDVIPTRHRKQKEILSIEASAEEKPERQTAKDSPTLLGGNKIDACTTLSRGKLHSSLSSKVGQSNPSLRKKSSEAQADNSAGIGTRREMSNLCGTTPKRVHGKPLKQSISEDNDSGRGVVPRKSPRRVQTPEAEIRQSNDKSSFVDDLGVGKITSGSTINDNESAKERPRPNQESNKAKGAQKRLRTSQTTTAAPATANRKMKRQKIDTGTDQDYSSENPVNTQDETRKVTHQTDIRNRIASNATDRKKADTEYADAFVDPVHLSSSERRRRKRRPSKILEERTLDVLAESKSELRRGQLSRAEVVDSGNSASQSNKSVFLSAERRISPRRSLERGVFLNSEKSPLSMAPSLRKSLRHTSANLKGSPIQNTLEATAQPAVQPQVHTAHDDIPKMPDDEQGTITVGEKHAEETVRGWVLEGKLWRGSSSLLLNGKEFAELLRSPFGLGEYCDKVLPGLGDAKTPVVCAYNTAVRPVEKTLPVVNGELTDSSGLSNEDMLRMMN